MNGKKEHNATNANNKGYGVRGTENALGFRICIVLLLIFSPFSNSYAYEGAAPALSGVKEILVQSAHLGGNSLSSGCSLSEDKLTVGLVKSLKVYDVPAVSVVAAKPAQIGVPRINLMPEVVTSSSQGVECTSWVALSAETRQTLRVPPIDVPRSIIVTYWRGGLMVNSSSSSHQRALTDAFDKLARQFSQQYRLDQPPPLPSLEEETK